MSVVSLGLSPFPNFSGAESSEPADFEPLLSIARDAERDGVETVWTSDSVTRSIPRFDTMIYLAALASATSTIKIGTCVVVTPLRHPIELGKTFATLDVLSRGRMILGVGTGWLEEEFNYLGADFPNRGAVTTESMALIKRMWSENNVSHSSQHFQINDYSLNPKPIQKPLPMYVGGNSKRAFARLVEHGDGWIAPSSISADDLRAGVEHINELWKAAGRSGRPRIVAELNMHMGPDEAESQKEIEAWHASFHRKAKMPILSGSSAPTIVRVAAIGPTGLAVEMIDDLVAAGADEVMCRFLAFDWRAQYDLLAKDVIPNVAAAPVRDALQ